MAGTYTVSERWSSRKRSGGSSNAATVEYIIQETTAPTLSADDGEVIQALIDTAPETWGTAEIPRSSYDVEQIADRIWVGTVNYGYSSKNTGTIEYNFDTGGGSQKITQTISPLTVTAYGDNPPDFKGAINVDDNSVNGIDIIVPVFNFNETKQIGRDFITTAFKTSVFRLTSKVNSQPWHGFEAGEVLFMGASGSKHGRTGDYELNFKFAASPNKTNITIGSITGINKKGWEYLWVRYEKSTDQNCLIQIPRAVYVHQVYESGDFSALGLGD
ncbi:MAG: hypothetical protein BWY69_00146 [Planctomycetes bacterium ADurb.Bin401]|jgi:hypothetical protein|nr:MAG: hypothetical protein BWY69_00146 [Planctomycetes bacterium ADurb.Bin401]